jgi:hypothetical protein
VRKRRFHDQSLWAVLLRFLRLLVAPSPNLRRSEPGKLADAFAEHDAAGVLAAAEPATGGQGLEARRWRHSQGLLASVAGAALLGAIVFLTVSRLNQVSAPTPPAVPTVPTPAATLLPTVPPLPAGGRAAIMVRSYGRGLLAQPQEAVRLPDGRLAVADTGHHRVLLFSSTGKQAGVITSGQHGPLQAPFSLAVLQDGSLLVLDSDAGQVLKYGPDNRLLAASSAALPLGHARGIAVDVLGGVLVVSPAMNAVYLLSPDLTSQGARAAVSGNSVLFSQPSAIVAGRDGSVYVVDSQNNRLERFSSRWSLLGQWPISVADTQHSPRAVIVPGGGVLVSSPGAGKLVYFPGGSGNEVVYSLPGGSAARPLGLSMLGASHVLVTCSGSGTVLEVRLPGLP